MARAEQDLLRHMESLARMVGAKWKPAVLLSLIFNGRQRFSELKRGLPGITQRMLAERLRELEADGLVNRIAHADMPMRVEYEITDLGRSLQPIYKAMHDWASANEFALMRARRLSARAGTAAD